MNRWNGKLTRCSSSCYSAQEHTSLHSLKASSATASALPTDITIETIVATIVVCFGLIIGAPNLRPIQWRVWAGKVEREGEAGFRTGSGEVEKDYLGNPFKVLESRPGFVNIRKQRTDFAEWVKNGEKAATS